jgi:hypothetical protein
MKVVDTPGVVIALSDRSDLDKPLGNSAGCHTPGPGRGHEHFGV